MTVREELAGEIEKLSDRDLSETLEFVRRLRERADQDERSAPMLLAESALARDWLTPEEDSAWKDL